MPSPSGPGSKERMQSVPSQWTVAEAQAEVQAEAQAEVQAEAQAEAAAGAAVDCAMQPSRARAAPNPRWAQAPAAAVSPVWRGPAAVEGVCRCVR